MKVSHINTTLILSRSNNTVIIFNYLENICVRNLEGDIGKCSHLLLNEDGNLIVGLNNSKEIIIWIEATGEVFKIIEAEVNQIDFNTDYKYLVGINMKDDFQDVLLWESNKWELKYR